MQHVLVLTTDPATRSLTGADIGTASSALTSTATADRVGDPSSLADGIAAEIGFDGPPDAALAAVRGALAGHPVDVNVVSAANRRKRLLIADMDSTIITSESLDDLADFAGIKDRIAPITARAMRGEIGFEDALRERVAMLAGQPASLIARLLEERIEITPGAPTLVATMRDNGAYCALVSGGFDAVTGVIRQRLGFHVDRANHLVVEGDALAGRVTEPILGRDAKVTALRDFTGEHGLTAADVVAVGDGANDIAMLTTAGFGVAFRAKPAVRDAAPIVVDHGDLTALLYLQGYTEASFSRPGG